MRLGFALPQMGAIAGPDSIAAVAQRAEALGFDSLWVLDRILHSTLNDRRGLTVGSLILLEDVTGQKEAQAQLLEQQRALATLHERDRVARELHDTLGQVLGYIKMQAEVAQTFLERDAPLEAKRRLARLAAAAQDAQSDVREYILVVKRGADIAGKIRDMRSRILQDE